MSPLYNPYQAPQTPEAPAELPAPVAPVASAPRGQRKKKDLTLKQMLEHPNPKVRQAAKKAEKIQTAINTVNTATAQGKNVTTFLKQNPNVAATLKEAGINLAPVNTASRYSDKFWQKNDFKEIAAAANNISFDSLEQLRPTGVRAVQATRTVRVPTAQITQAARNQILYQLSPEARSRDASQRPVYESAVGSTAALIAEVNRPHVSNISRAKQAFVPQSDQKGRIKTDELGNIVYEPFRFDEPDKPFKETLEYKEYVAAVKDQNLPFWKEKWEIEKFKFFNTIKKGGEWLTNVFNVQKEFIAQGDNLTGFGTALNLAYNAISYAGTSVGTAFYNTFSEDLWRTQVLNAENRLRQMRAQGLTEDDRIVQQTIQQIESSRAHMERARVRDVYQKESQAAFRRSWENFKIAAKEEKLLEGRSEEETVALINQRKAAEAQAARNAIAPRGRAYDLVNRANSLVNKDPAKSLEMYQQAIKEITEAQKWDALSDPADPTWSYTWNQEPQREELFRESMASLELQKGAPLTNNEIRRLKMYYENTWREFWGEAVFDATNLIPSQAFELALAPLGAKFWNESAAVVTAGFRKTGKGFSKIGLPAVEGNIDNMLRWSEKAKQTVLNNTPVISYLRRQTVATVASKRQNTVYFLFSRISGSYRTTDDFLNAMESIGRVASNVRYAPDEATARQLFKQAQEAITGLQSITFEEFKRFHDVMDVDAAGIDFQKWRALYEDAMTEVEPEIRRDVENVLRSTGQFKDEAALRAEVNRQVTSKLSSPESVGWALGNFSEKFAGAYTDAHRLYKGSALFDDSISGNMALFFRMLADDNEEDALVRKIFKEVTEKMESGVKLKPGETFSHWIAASAATRNVAAKRTAMLMADTIEGMVKLGKFAVDIWAMFVLSLNPRWIVQNYIDSSVRAWIAGSNPLDDAATMVLSLHRQLVDEMGFLPIELGQSLARDGLNFSTSVTGRMVYGNWKPLPGPLGIISYFQYEVDRLKNLRKLSIEEASVEAAKALSQRYPEGSMMRKLSNLRGGVSFYKDAMSGAAQDFNTAIEFTLRLRTFHKEYFRNIKKLEQVLGGKIGMEALSPALRGVAQQIWDSADSNPRKLTALVEAMLREGAADTPSNWSSVIPPNLVAKMDALTDAERSIFISSVRDKLDDMVTDIYKAGRKPTSADFVRFFDDYEEDAKNVINLQMANAQRTKTISGQVGNQTTSVPNAQGLSVASSAVDKEAIAAAVERIGRVKGRFNPTKSFDDFKVAMGEYASIEVVPGTERHVLVSPDGKMRVTVGKDLIEGKRAAEINDLMHEVAIKTFVVHEGDFAVNAGFKSVDEFEDTFRIFIGDLEGPMKVQNLNPEQFSTLVDELEANPTLRRVLERTKGRQIPYEEAWKNYMRNLPFDKLKGQAWFDMVQARADSIHVPPGHVRHAGTRELRQTEALQKLINTKKLGDELEQNLRNFLGMYDQARKDLGQFYLWTEPGPKQFAREERAMKWDEFYWRQAEAYGYGETLKAQLVKMINDDPEEALRFLKEYNSDFTVNFLNSHGITDFSVIERAPKGVGAAAKEGQYAIPPELPQHRAPITQFKMNKGGKITNIQSDFVRKDLYERFLSPEKKAAILTTERWDLSEVAEQIPLKDQLFNAVHDSFKLTNEQARMYSRIIQDHIDDMVAESGQDAEYFLRRMGFLRVEGHLRAPDALRSVQAVLDNEGRHLLYGFGAKNSTDLIRQTSIMFYDDLLMLVQHSEQAADDILRLGDFLEKVTGKKLIKGKLRDEHIEVFADAFQKYILSGDAPNSKLKKPFERYAKWMSTVTGNALDTSIMSDLPEDVIDIIDRMFTPSRMPTPEAANRTMRIMARQAGVEFKSRKDLLDIVNESIAPIKKQDKISLKQTIMATGSMTEDQADATISLLEHRARAWGAINNRNPNEYIKRLRIVRTQEELEEGLAKMVPNPKFKTWFGGSAVVDEAGQPKVMYTGTRSGGFTKFDKSFAKGEENLWGPGFYFTENTDIASEYATQNRDYIDMFVDFGNTRKFLTEDETRRLMKVVDDDLKAMEDQLDKFGSMSEQARLDDITLMVDEMNIKRDRDYLLSNKQIFEKHTEDGKLDTVTIQAWANDSAQQTKYWADRLQRANISGGLKSDTPTVMPVYLSIQNPFDLDKIFTRDEAIKLMEDVDPYIAKWLKHTHGADQIKGDALYNLVGRINNISKREINDTFKAAGYDGFTHIGGGRFIAGDTRRHRVFVALEPEQIKSVFNSGEFSLTNADILNKFDGLPTTADRRQPAYEQLRNMWDKLDEEDRQEVFKWITERTLVDPMSGLETLVAKVMSEKPEGWMEATSDLNALTAINNTWGHEAGDTLISDIGRIAREETAAAGGRVFRVGGDEFTYWFPTQEAAEKAMKNIDNRVSTNVFVVDGKRRKGFSVSYGIAEDHNAADKALYLDKQRRIKTGQRPLVRDAMPRTVRWEETVADFQPFEVANELPPVPSGHVRLYRGEPVPTGAQFPDWIKATRDELGITEAEGRWFTDSLDNARWYKNEANTGRIVYVDVPESVAAEASLRNQPRDVQRFSRDLEREFFLPKEIANQKQAHDMLAKRESNLQSFLGKFSNRGDDDKVIAIFENADFVTLQHELGHMFRTELPEADLRLLEKKTGLGVGDFEYLKSRFAAYNMALEGHLSPEALAMSRTEYDAYFKALQADANKYEKAEEMFADGFVKYLKSGRAPIPELQSVFEKFKAWLSEIWNALKKNSDFSLRLDSQTRGIYDRLFQVPPGAQVPPMRYTNLSEVPMDIAGNAFRSQASQQIIDNINAAFDVWKLRYDLQGLPQAALKDFATAKAYVKQQFMENTGDLANQYRVLMWRFEQFEDAMAENMMKHGFIDRVDKTVDDFFAPMLGEVHMDDGVKTFMRNGVHNRRIYDQMLEGIHEWRNFLTNAADNGTPFPVLTKEEALSLKEWATGAAERKAKIMDLSINGGKHEGISVEGALPKTNRFMLDYQDRNNFDQIMKNFFPFWMFPSRSLPFWTKTLMTHPQIMMLYQKMRKMSEAERYQAGAVTSKGAPLPSLENHIPIPGLGMWINPSAPLSFRYLLDMQSYGDDMLYKVRNADGGDEGAYAFLSKQFMEMSPVFGFTPGPWVQIAARQAGVDVQRWSLIPQTNLIPPWWMPELVQRSEMMMNWMAPEPPWHDFLVERSMLEEANQAISNPQMSDRDKKALLAKVGQAIAEKGENPLWTEAYRKYVLDEKKRNVGAFFTGFYPKEFSDAQADLLHTRNENIMMASAMNNSFQANLIGIPLNEQVRWDNYREQYKVDTPLGWLYHLYSDIGWVTDSANHLVTDPKERARLVANRIEEDNNARSYFQSVQSLENWKNVELATLPIGANYEQTEPIYDGFYDRKTKLEAALMPPWHYMGSNKPVSLIEKDIRNLWWRRLSEARPAWVEGMEYEEYEKRLLEWERNLPKIAQTFSRRFMRDPQIQNYMRYLDVDQPLDLTKLMTQLISSSNVREYNLWKLENDDIFTALNTVWKENYWDKYWDAVGPLTHEERDIAEMDFFESNPPPQMNDLYKWVVEKYGPDRFSRGDVQRWIQYDPEKEMEIYSIDQRHLQDIGETAATRERIWSILSWAGPGKQRDIIENAFADVGGDVNDLQKWYDAGGKAWEDDPAHVADFYNMLSKAAQDVQLRSPNRAQLEQFLAARKENDILTEILEDKLGADYQKSLNLYFFKSDNLGKREFKIWRSENRDINKLVKDYFYTREVFGYTHKLWSSYYQWKPKPRPTNIGEQYQVVSTPMPSAPESAQRPGVQPLPIQPIETKPTVPNTPTFFSFGAPWPAGMKERISPNLIREVEQAYRGNGKLSSSARAYLNSLYKYNPEWRQFIEGILSIR